MPDPVGPGHRDCNDGGVVADERTPPVAPDRLPVGREPELELLEGLIDALPGRGSALVVRGDAGIGKSALLDVLGRSAARRGFAVLGTTGVQSETHLPFAGLHQLLRPLLGALGRLPARQREAVEAAFGMSTSVAPDTFLIGLGCLELIADAASDSAVILVVDDAHWLDSATCDVLAFVARRVELDPILVVFATRAGLDSRIARSRPPDARGRSARRRGGGGAPRDCLRLGSTQTSDDAFSARLPEIRSR